MSDQEARDSASDEPVMEYAGYRFGYRNQDEFTRICQDVFDGHEYGFATRERSPLIVDAGAHVGVATHYFKRRYPGARVLAYEANPVTFRLLQQNIARNQLDGVVATQAALAPEPGEITFYAAAGDDEPGAWGDSAIRQPWHENEVTAAVRVPAVTLSSILTEPVDLLKLDIEGMETAVLAEAAPHLSLVKRVVLEFHGTKRNPDNSINRLIEVLREAGLTPEIRQFGEVIAIPHIQRDDPYWLMVRAERLNGLQRLWRMFG
ncbi:MAG: FkbM family methyltransferase [Thermomicrobiales bacterium]|nr:FkbM family methyltransferase [Thermomicrobiales bacterium]